ncbi:MAG TPA: hypothetical protein VHJ82_08330 [Actinomycetota bacterium]|nr:hypothetical protein [Actinomycetota bacterium]
MASKAVGIRLETTVGTARRPRKNPLKSFARAFREWAGAGQLTGYSDTELSRQTGSRI